MDEIKRGQPDRGLVRTVVVSLADAHRRRRMCVDNLSANPFLRWSFFDACTVESPSVVSPNRAAQLRKYGREMTNAEIGVFKSHVQVLHEFLASGEEWLLVLEDDVAVDPFFDPRSLFSTLRDLDIHHLRLFAKFFMPARDVTSLDFERKIIRFLSDPSGMQAYLVDRVGARRLVDSVVSIDLPIDDEFGRFWSTGLPLFAVFPFPTMEMQIPSAISDGRQQGNVARKRKTEDLTLAKFRGREKLAKAKFNFFYRVGRRQQGAIWPLSSRGSQL